MRFHALLSNTTIRRCLGLMALLALRIVWLRAYPVNSDEAQHAHIAWSVGQGELPYRDVFDNHGPLFSTIYAPLMHALGERSDILVWLRLAVVPWYLLALLGTWFLARRLYSRGVADASVAMVGLAHFFFVKMGEFRTDDLWAALWLCALAVAVHAGGRIWRWVVVGFLLGAALAVSQKTLLLWSTALLAAGCVWATPWRSDARRLLRGGLAVAMGAVVVPGVFAVWLAMQHDFGPAWYDLVTYNLAPTGDPARAGPKILYAILAVAIAAATASWLRRARYTEPWTRWRLFLVLQGTLFGSLIWFAWPLRTAQDYLPVIPTLFVWLTGTLSRSGVLRGPRAVTTVALVVAVELVFLVTKAPPWHDTVAPQEAQLRTVLACTTHDDTVMDAKSGAIFRQRPYPTVLEALARRRFAHELATDDIAMSLVERRTMTVIVGGLPPATKAFVAQNYLPGTGNVSMAGKMLPGRGHRRAFEIALPGNYTVADGTVEVPVSIDGGPSASRWYLSAGTHSLESSSDRRLVSIWSRAWNCGWRPTVTPGVPAAPDTPPDE
ncbi:MAG TPA: hypothetical protein VM621_13340 [Luteibacter sp.]|uniref:ArnT family glycosyltransferase n=1 Tax=Luteibacter sp. TaxID=1886636 RepID=UPI002C9BD41B|nr:hypothetical protein [Luteibacter sp.]HVI56021.1 hypothetical protein [Luteibacter sp.]